MADYYNNQLIIEARYNDSLFFNDFNVLQEIINKMKNIFTNCSYDNKQRIVFLNDKFGKNSIQISKNRLVLNANEPESFSKFREIGCKAINLILSDLKIDTLNRIGMRSIRGINKKDLDECSLIIKNNLFKFKDSAVKYLNTIKQCSAGLNFTINDYKIVLNIRPNVFQVIQIQNNKLQRQISKYQILLDSDIFKNNVKIDFTGCTNNIDKFIADVISINEDNIDKFLCEMGVN